MMGALKPAGVDDGPAHGHEFEDRCPTCDQTIPREQSQAVRTRIEARETAQTEHLRQELAKEKRDAVVRAEAEIAAMKTGFSVELGRARDEARAAAEHASAAKLAEADVARKSAERTAEAVLAQQAATLEMRLKEMRETVEREKMAAIQAEQAKAFEDKQKSLVKIAELQRQLESKTAQELGDGPEADLFELLKAEFPEDRISRVEKGAAGADVVQDIYLNGRLCGRIVYDAKNRSAWRNDYVTKLRADQVEAKADHAVLSSKVFPSGVRELHLQDGVLVVTPSRVLVVANLLRKHVVQTFALRSGNEARAQKTEALYAFIMSDRCGQLLSTIETQADDLVDLDRKEERAHQATWKRRGELIRTVQRAHGDLTFEIDRIIGVAGNRARPLDSD
jgi:hypothetical protein